MEALVGLIALLILSAFLIVPVMVFVLWSRVERLQNEMRELRRAVYNPPPQVSEFPRRAAIMPQPTPAIRKQDLDLTPYPGMRIPDLDDAIIPPVAEAFVRDYTSPPPLPPVAPLPQAKSVSPTARKPAPQLPNVFEAEFAERWLTWAGALALILGTGFFVKYAIDQGWLNETIRVFLGLGVGLASLIGATIAMRKNYQRFAEGLAGASLGMLYMSLFAASQWYHLLSIDQAFAAMTLVTTAGIAFAAYFNAQSTAILGLIGGLLTPIMLSTGQDAQVALFSYLLLLTAGVLIVSTFRNWPALKNLAFVGSILMWGGWITQHYHADKFLTTILFMIAFFVVFVGISVWHHFVRRVPLQDQDVPLILAVPFVFFWGFYGATAGVHAGWHGPFALILSPIYALLGFIARARYTPGNRLQVCLWGVAVAFAILAVPLTFTGHWIVVAWLLESSLLIALGLRFQLQRLRAIGLALFSLAQLILLIYGLSTFAQPSRFSPDFLRPPTWLPPFPQTAYSPPQLTPIIPTDDWSTFLNARAFDFAISATLFAGLAWGYRRRFGITVTRLGDASDPAFVGGCLLAGLPLSLFWLFSVEFCAFGVARQWTQAAFLSFYLALCAGTAMQLIQLAMRFGPLWVNRVSLPFTAGVAVLTFFVSSIVFFSDHQAAYHMYDAWQMPLINPRGLSLLFAINCLAYSAWLMHRSERVKDPFVLWYRGILSSFAFVMVWVLLSVEVFAESERHQLGTGSNLNVTLIWTLFALITLVVGIVCQSAKVRQAAIVVFAATTLKVFLFDVWQLSTGIRYIAFTVLGVALLTVSFGYQRYRDRIRAAMPRGENETPS